MEHTRDFDPSKYFGGLIVNNLGDAINDIRL